jgi:hypothetical protein
MNNSSNLAMLPTIKDGDGDGGAESPTFQIMIDIADNGFILNVMGENDLSKVYLFAHKGADGPSGLIQEIINQLGIADKVKLEK